MDWHFFVYVPSFRGCQSTSLFLYPVVTVSFLWWLQNESTEHWAYSKRERERAHSSAKFFFGELKWDKSIHIPCICIKGRKIGFRQTLFCSMPFLFRNPLSKWQTIYRIPNTATTVGKDYFVSLSLMRTKCVYWPCKKKWPKQKQLQIHDA